MKIHLYSLILVLLFFAFGTSQAKNITNQPTSNFKYLTTEDGLGDLTVLSILQDQLGIIWIGATDGLYKYDGERITTIKNNFFQETGRGSQVELIRYNPQNEKLWLSVDNHIFTLDLKTEIIEEKKMDLPGAILTLFVDSTGLLWISVADNGLFTYDENNDKFSKFSEIKTLEHLNIVDIQQEGTHSLGFLTKFNGLFFYDKEKNTFTCTDTKIKRASTYLKDKHGNYWVGSFYGLYHLPTDGSQPIPVILDRVKENEIFYISKIIERPDGTLYIGTDSGLYTYDPQTNQVNMYKANWLRNGELNCNYLNDVYLDKENTLWLGTFFGGINYLTDPNLSIQKYDYVNKHMSGHVISSFAEDENGNLWIGTNDGGVSYFNKTTETVTNYNPNEHKESIINFHNVHALLYDNGLLYVGLSSAGVYIYDTHTKKTIGIYQQNELMTSLTVTSLHKMDDGKIAIGTTKGVDFFNPQTQEISHCEEIPNTWISKIFADHQGTVWVCGEESGIYFKEKGKEHFEKSIEQLNKFPTYCGTYFQKYVFFGTENNGVIKYNIETKEVVSLLKEELTNHLVYNIIAQDSSLWISTTNGLYQYPINNTTNSRYTKYTEGHGLKSNRMKANAGIQTADGTIFIGTMNGLNGFHPRELKYSTTPSQTIFTNLTINNESIKPNQKDSPLQYIMAYTNSLTLSHQQSSFSISFASMNYSQKRGVSYRYKLLPIDVAWNYTDNNSLNIKHLQSGKYTLVVSCCNENGIWDTKGTAMDITILPPWWKTPYMLTLYTVLFILAIYFIIRSIRKKQEQRIREVQLKQEQELYQSKMTFFTQVIHDIRTPLTLILSPLQKLIDSNESKPFRFELDIMKRNGEHLLNNVNKLMDFQKLKQNVDHYTTIEPINIVEEVQNLVHNFHITAENKGIHLSVHSDEMNSAYLTMANKECFTKILTNLIANAIKFTRTKVYLNIKEEHDSYQISVSDDGIGIAKEQQKTIFEPFYQVKDNLPHDNIGTGIGLSIVKDMAEKLGGSVTLQSTVGEGTTFTLVLPIRKPENAIAPQADVKECISEEKVAENKEEAGAAASQWTIFVAEDNVDLRKFLVSILQPHYNVFDFENGQDLINELSLRQCDLIVSDVMMPVMDGIQLCNLVKTDTDMCHIPVLLLTAKVMDKDEINGLEHGADAYIRKPFSVEVLLARIKNLIKNRELLSLKFRKEPETQLSESIQNDKDADFIKKMDEIITQNLKNPELNSTLVASGMCMCRSLFFSKIKAISGMTFSDYVRVKRLKYAVEMIKSKQYSFNEISDATGFSSPSFFTRSFKKQFGLTPSEYLNQLNEGINPPDMDTNGQEAVDNTTIS